MANSTLHLAQTILSWYMLKMASCERHLGLFVPFLADKPEWCMSARMLKKSLKLHRPFWPLTWKLSIVPSTVCCINSAVLVHAHGDAM